MYCIWKVCCQIVKCCSYVSNNPEAAHSHIHLLWSHYAGSLNDVNPSFQLDHIVPVFFIIVCDLVLVKVKVTNLKTKVSSSFMSSSLKVGKVCFTVATQSKSLLDEKGNG